MNIHRTLNFIVSMNVVERTLKEMSLKGMGSILHGGYQHVGPDPTVVWGVVCQMSYYSPPSELKCVINDIFSHLK